jgi:hypothetical protein
VDVFFIDRRRLEDAHEVELVQLRLVNSPQEFIAVLATHLQVRHRRVRRDRPEDPLRGGIAVDVRPDLVL